MQHWLTVSYFTPCFSFFHFILCLSRAFVMFHWSTVADSFCCLFSANLSVGLCVCVRLIPAAVGRVLCRRGSVTGASYRPDCAQSRRRPSTESGRTTSGWRQPVVIGLDRRRSRRDVLAGGSTAASAARPSERCQNFAISTQPERQLNAAIDWTWSIIHVDDETDDNIIEQICLQTN